MSLVTTRRDRKGRWGRDPDPGKRYRDGGNKKEKRKRKSNQKPPHIAAHSFFLDFICIISLLLFCEYELIVTVR
jgi:hypothetical protein